jgi:ComF family protein
MICGIKTSPPDQNICKNCLKKIKKKVPPFCIKCGRELPGDPELQDSCSDCKRLNPCYNRAFSVFHYDEDFKKLMHNFKYKKIVSLAKEFVELTVDFMDRHGIGRSIDLVLSIPMHPARSLRRGINPSHILAKDTAKKLGITYSDKILKKTKNTVPQTKLKRHDRINNVKGSFSIQKNKTLELKRKNILLMDDLFTTGSTVNECSRVLKETGSAYIEVVTLARGNSPL